ncbi:MAG TPA: homoserine dehydrogenase [Elusimicrobiota bacterium]|nr:homoserine dehydrogenase [Elusimicrobiota bacterium]
MNEKKTVNVGLIGFGTVGQGVVKILDRNLPLLESKFGGQLRLTWVCDKYSAPLRRAGVHRPRFTRRWEDVVRDPSVDVVVELIGGYEPARTIVLSALRSGKHVATANKALLAKYWSEVFETTRKTKSLIYFEASVGAGIPIIQSINEGLAANRIQAIYGILNGTTNYILTRMTQDGLDFAKALKEAQREGFAEADPSFDIEGTDAAHKVSVLASLASGTWVHLDDVHRQGIGNLDVWDVLFAQERLGYVTKLLGIIRFQDRLMEARVHPALIPSAHPFASVNREYNAVYVYGDAAGDIMFYGKGAGQMTAASAVVSDILFLARQIVSGTAGKIPYVSFHPSQRMKISPLSRSVCRHYLRFMTDDKPGVLSKITGILGQKGVSIEAVYQSFGSDRFSSRLPALSGRSGVPIVIVTHKAMHGAVQRALEKIDRLPVVRRKTIHLRIEEL